MKFINRKQEIGRLNRIAKSTKSELVVVWGRRRLGKTRLLLEWAKEHNGIYYAADESSASVQRKYFSLAIDQALPGFADVEYPDWATLFARLAKDSIFNGWRGPLIIDEFPYLVSASPELPSVLQRFIDHEAKKAKMYIALCGSSQRLMQGAILDASAPLFGRASEIIKLQPISVGYMGEALGLKNSREIIESYSVWGGIPRYWELVNNNNGTFINSIDDLILNPMGPLNDEPNRLLLEEASMSLRPILDAIGLGAHRLSEVAARIGQPTTSFTRSIQKLLELDLIDREIPFGADEYNSKKTLYKIKDPFMRFWFEVVAPERSFYTQASATHRKTRIAQFLSRIYSLEWEEICRRAVPNILYNISAFGQANRYWDKNDSEWDIIAESMDKKVVVIGEAKWTAKAPTEAWIYKTIEKLIQKGKPKSLKLSKQLTYYILFIPEKPHNLKLPDHIKVIDAKEVIESYLYA